MIRLIVDSTCDLLPHVKEQVTVVPLPIRFGEEEYLDGVTIDHKRFYEMLVESDVLPTTSQPSPEVFADIFRQVEQAGDKAVVLTLSANLSGTFQSASIAQADFPGTIYVVDSHTAAIGTGILAEHALNCIEKGMSAIELVRELEQTRGRISVVAMVDTLEYLQKGGRVSKAIAIAGGLLSIKPVLSIRDGEITILGKARGSRQGNNLLVQEIEKAGGVDFSMPVLLGYTGLSDVLLQKYIDDSERLWAPLGSRPRFTVIGSVVGTHAGPGAVAVAFFKKQ